MLFSGNFFSARVAAPAPGASPFDEGGWGAYGDDWRYYFDCMLAPAAKQAAGEPARCFGWLAAPAGRQGRPLCRA